MTVTPGATASVTLRLDQGGIVAGTVVGANREPVAKARVRLNTGVFGNTTIQNIAILSDCRISGGSGTLFTNVILASTATGNGSDPFALQNISLSANAVLGIDDGCAPSGGVQIFSEASVHTAAGTVISGSQIVARGDVDLTAGSDGFMGVAIQAGALRRRRPPEGRSRW